jgi:hypothetical protein
VKKASCSPSLRKRKGWGMSFEHSDFLVNTTFFAIYHFYVSHRFYFNNLTFAENKIIMAVTLEGESL